MCYKYYDMNYTYLFVGGGLGGMTYYTYKNPGILMPYVINLIKYYHMVADYYHTENKDKDIKKIKRKHSCINLICYNADTKEENYAENIKDSGILDLNSDKYDLKIIEKTIDDRKYYKRLYEKDLNKLIKDNHFFFGFLDDKPFLQVVYDDSTKTIDIHLELKPFYIDRSRILDDKFLKWFMKKFHNYEIENKDYRLNIIDNNVNMEYITNKDYIVLRNDKDTKYEIVRNEII